MSIKRNKYSDEFKVEAINLAKKIGFTKAAEELGVRDSMIHKWSKKLNQNSRADILSPAKPDLEAEIRQLRKENRYLKEINEVLKKSTAIFSSSLIGDLK